MNQAPTPRKAPRVVVVDEDRLREVAGLDADALATVEAAFTWLAEGRARVPPIMIIEVEGEGEVDVKTAYVEGLETFAVKIASGFPGNADRGLPPAGGLMVAVGSHTGLPEAVLLDNGYLTDLRTALAGAVAARHLAPRDVETVGVFGTGSQARWQPRALRLVRPFSRLLVHGRRRDAAERCAAELAESLGVEARAAGADETVRESQVVITATSAREPILRSEWLHERLHITAMGSDTPGKRELGPGVLRRADLVVCDRRSQVLRLGELQAAEAEDIDIDEVVELGEITSGRRPGRTSEAQLTVCDLTGVGVQDTAIATFAVERIGQTEG